jgi:hypothetical protein
VNCGLCSETIREHVAALSTSLRTVVRSPQHMTLLSMAAALGISLSVTFSER